MTYARTTSLLHTVVAMGVALTGGTLSLACGGATSSGPPITTGDGGPDGHYATIGIAPEDGGLDAYQNIMFAGCSDAADEPCYPTIGINQPDSGADGYPIIFPKMPDAGLDAYPTIGSDLDAYPTIGVDAGSDAYPMIGPPPFPDAG